MTEPLRLARRLADMLSCSRREAELYIEGGWVRVDGIVVELPQLRVRAEQTVALDPQAKAEALPPVTILLHKPPDFRWEAEVPRSAQALLVAAQHWQADRSGHRLVRRHLAGQVCVTPLEPAASGLLVFTQEYPVRRKLQEEGALVENEVIVEVSGPVSEAALHALNRAPVIDGRAMLPAKVSVTSRSEQATGLRFALKGHYPGQIAQMCDSQRLQIRSMRRIRVGRIPLAALPSGQWRFMMPYERF